MLIFFLCIYTPQVAIYGALLSEPSNKNGFSQRLFCNISIYEMRLLNIGCIVHPTIGFTPFFKRYIGIYWIGVLAGIFDVLLCFGSLLSKGG
jgi:hypothetical protein